MKSANWNQFKLKPGTDLELGPEAPKGPSSKSFIWELASNQCVIAKRF